MNAKDALADFLAPLREGDTRRDVEAWLEDDWFRIQVGGRLRPVLPLFGLKRAQALHDLHHVLTGYGTSLREELRLAAWELGSGGCAWTVAYWVDRIAATLLGLVCTPATTVRAFRRGLGERNLYGRARDEVLARDVEDLRAELGIRPAE